MKWSLEKKAQNSPLALESSNNPYERLNTLLKVLNEHPQKYCVVLHVIDDSTFREHTSLNDQIRSLLSSLTKREMEVFDLAIHGLKNRLIADKLSITIETVKSHRKNIVSKAGARDIEEIKDWLLQVNLV